MRLSTSTLRKLTALTCSLLAVAAARPASAQAPARLQLPEAARLNGEAYALELSDSVVIDFHGSQHHAQRAVRFRFHFSGANPEADGWVGASLAIDSLILSLATPHGDEVALTHGLSGTSLPVRYRRAGGGATYSSDVPLIDFAEMGGAFPLSSLIDHVFPALSNGAVRVGESWEHWWTRKQIDGGTPSERSVTTRYTLAALETRGGQAVARVNVSVHGDAGRGTPAAGPVDASGFVLVRVSDGVVLEVSSDETVSGTWSFEGQDLPFKQTTRVRALNTSVGKTAPQD